MSVGERWTVLDVGHPDRRAFGEVLAHSGRVGETGDVLAVDPTARRQLGQRWLDALLEEREVRVFEHAPVEKGVDFGAGRQALDGDRLPEYHRAATEIGVVEVFLLGQ